MAKRLPLRSVPSWGRKRASAEVRKLIFVLTLLHTCNDEVPSNSVPSLGMRRASADMSQHFFVFNPIVHTY